jgi:hypothetical protein
MYDVHTQTLTHMKVDRKNQEETRERNTEICVRQTSSHLDIRRKSSDVNLRVGVDVRVSLSRPTTASSFTATTARSVAIAPTASATATARTVAIVSTAAAAATIAPTACIIAIGSTATIATPTTTITTAA